MEDALARDQRVALRPRPHMPAIGSIAEAKEDDSEEKDGSFGVRLNGAIDQTHAVLQAAEGDLDDDSAARSGTRRSFQHKRAAMKERAASEQTRREGMIRDAKQAIHERQQARVEAMKERNEQFNSRMRAKFGLDDKENGEQGLPTSDHPRRPPSVEPSV